ncbi:MAG: hypothetical protein K9N46_09395 [Candidatus Marinimicrobia bacterium]|nr:hypothetical protein [Candidatus Neomarinimicrobiota bacterium]MCF7829452.1 hypothetical protein [Candidatus Neomarinimicrobiota bacterium]MCF7880938.1 hypothetical protein [Candidatus Neomarinimicrobiota bacterium]
MKRIKTFLTAILSLIVMLAFVSTTQAGEKHKDKAKKDKKSMTGVISVQQTSNGPDYYLTVHPETQQSKTVDIKFTEKVEEDLPDAGQEVTVKGHFAQEQQNQFMVTDIVTPKDQRQKMGQK